MQIVYYSLSGATGQIASKLAADLDLKPDRIEDASSRQGPFNFIRSGFEATFKIRPRIKMPEHYQTDADHVILLAPIWAGRICSPMRTFCVQNAGRFRSFSLILTHLSPQNKYETMKDEVEKITGARCRLFESYCSKDMSGIDVHALYLRLRKTV